MEFIRSGGSDNMSATITTGAKSLEGTKGVLQVELSNTDAVGTLQLQRSLDGGTTWRAINLYIHGNIAGYPAPEDTVSISGTSVQSAALSPGVVKVVSTTACHMLQGSNPTAVAANHKFLPAGVEAELRVNKTGADDKLAFIQTSAAGVAYINTYPDAYPIASGVDDSLLIDLDMVITGHWRAVYTSTSGDGQLDVLFNSVK